MHVREEKYGNRESKWGPYTCQIKETEFASYRQCHGDPSHVPLGFSMV